jgi:uncharacterized protein (DUF1800 family)
MNMDTSLTPINPRDFGPAQARHLLLRAGFGAGPLEIAQLAESGPQQALRQLFQTPLPDDTLADIDPDIIHPPTAQERERIAKARKNNDEATRSEIRRIINERRAKDRRMLAEMRRDWVRLMINTQSPLQEKLVLLWHSHFASRHRNVRDTFLMYQQNQLFREHAAGSFADLARAVVRDPAMLKFLNNDQNNKRKPNENLAREFMELFTLGEGNYDEKDIKQGARALTGYHVNDNDFAFRDRRHDNAKKTILGKTGKLDGDDFIDILLDQPACSRYIALKLYRHFVADVSDHLDEVQGPHISVIQRIATMLRKNNYQITPVLKTLFLSKHFYDPKIVGQKIKSPAQLVIGTARSLNTPGPPTRSLGTLSDGMRIMGQDLFDPPSVAGWDGGRSWINTSTLFTRQNVCTYLITGKDPRRKKWNRNQTAFDPMPLLANLDSREPKSVVDHLVNFMLGEHTPAPRREPLVKFMQDRSKGVTPDSMIALLTLITATPEYQLC